MIKPHEDNWEHVSGEYPDTVYRAGTQNKIADVWADGIASGNDTADLIASAPEMARMLLGWACGGHEWECPSCEHDLFVRDVPIAELATLPPFRPEKHAPDCALVAVLRKAGVIPG